MKTRSLILISRLRIQHLMIDSFGSAFSVNVQRQIEALGRLALILGNLTGSFFFQGFDP